MPRFPLPSSSFCIIRTSSLLIIATRYRRTLAIYPATWSHFSFKLPIFLLFIIKVVNKSDLFPLLSLGHDNFPAVPTLVPNSLEAPDLLGSPAFLLVLGRVCDEQAVVLNLPALLEVLVRDVAQFLPAAAALDGAKQPVGVLALKVVEAAVLLRAGQARRGLRDVDVGDDVGGRVGRAGRALVLLYLDGDGGEADAHADQETDALEFKHRLRGVRERFVLLTPRPALVLAEMLSPFSCHVSVC